jgi:ribosome biogenesis protein ENP2
MSLAITISNQVKCYNLSICPTLPQFLEEAYKTQKSLKHNELYRKRIEVIQDFDFPTACTQVEQTEDSEYIVAAGVYPINVTIGMLPR